MHLLSEAKWMDSETKFYAINKLKNLKVIVGYPNWQMKRSFVNNYYGNVSM
jgi:predicted metalloendopeptidase